MMNTSEKTTELRIIFAGTPEFAAVALQAILKGPHQIVGVYTQPDRPSGRGRKLTSSPVKQLALEYDIPVFQPASLKCSQQQNILVNLNADVMVVAAYGLILPEEILNAPHFGCINIHASLLPRWRGAAPIQHAILAGDDATGITIMQMDVDLDTGNMMYVDQCQIAENDTGSSLHDHLAIMGAEAITKVLGELPKYQHAAQAQDNNLTTYATKLNKSIAVIDWQQSAVQIAQQIKAFNSWPVAHTNLGELRIRVWQASVFQDHANEPKLIPGTIISSNTDGIDVVCKQGILRLEIIQLPGAKALPVAAVLNSRHALFQPNAIFGTMAL